MLEAKSVEVKGFHFERRSKLVKRNSKVNKVFLPLCHASRPKSRGHRFPLEVRLAPSTQYQFACSIILKPGTTFLPGGLEDVRSLPLCCGLKFHFARASRLRRGTVQVKDEGESKAHFKSCLTKVTVSSHARTRPRSEDGNVVSATHVNALRRLDLRSRVL